MEFSLVYRIIRDPETNLIIKIETVEYCKYRKEADRDCKFFNLQVPLALRNTVTYKTYHSELIE